MIDIVMVVGGLVLLVFAGDALVKGAVNLSLRLGIPAAIVGLTVVAFGTSAPELLVSVQAVLDGLPTLALGNVIGSNIANVLLVLGVPALIAAVPVTRDETQRDFVAMILATLLFIGLAFLGPLTWWHGLILLAGLTWMLLDGYRRAQAHREGREEDLEGAEPGMPLWKIIAFLVAGIIGLPLGAHFLVDGASNIALRLGVSEAVIGLTLVAVGTSLPELATTVMAAIRREAGVALGNVIGSNMFNLMGILGVAALVGPLPLTASMLSVDLWVMLAASLVLGLFVWRSMAIGRGWGLGFLGLYIAYVISLFLMPGGAA